VDDNGIAARHVPYMNPGTEDNFSPCLDRMNSCMIKDRDIPGRLDRSLYPALASDDSAPAENVKGNTGTGSEFKIPCHIKPSPEVSTGRNNEIPLYPDISFEIPALLRVKGLALSDNFDHDSLWVLRRDQGINLLLGLYFYDGERSLLIP